jgi:arabinose-5-phosphate isomerase
MTTAKKMKEILERQGRELAGLYSANSKALAAAFDLIGTCKGAVVVVGFGKSGAIGAKLAATFRSAGRRAYLLSPVDAFYGEAVAVSGDDVAIVISSSGESAEIIRIVPWLKKKGVRIIALNPSGRSSLSRAADVVLRTIAPADSTDNYASYSTCIGSLALGDLLGLSVLYEQGVDRESFEIAEPGGTGKVYTVDDMLAARPGNPIVRHGVIFRDALVELTSKGLGAISVTAEDGTLAGIITDGDVRRLMQRSQDSLARLFLTNVESVMTRNPRRVGSSETLMKALTIMEDNAITVLPVVNAESAPVGMIHLHDLVQLGLQYSPKKLAPVKKTASRSKSARSKK